MNIIDNDFLELAKKVAFIQLKEGTEQRLGSYKIDDKLPLPVITESFLDSIKQESFDKGINFEHILNGIIYILGTDKDFRYNEDYLKILKELSKESYDFIQANAIRLLSEDRFIESAIVFRALLFIGEESEVILFNYGLALEGIAHGQDDLEKRKAYLKYALEVFERILDINENFALAYYKLGFYYKETDQFVKAKLIWDKYLLLDDDENRKSIIREELVGIDKDINFEDAVLSVARGDFENALVKLKKLSELSNWWNISYLIGISYRGLNRTEEAIEEFLKALENGGEDPNLYNELGVSYFLIGEAEEAIDYLDKGIKLDKENYELYFNLGIIYSKLGEYEEALKNYELAYSLNMGNEYIREQYMNMQAITQQYEE